MDFVVYVLVKNDPGNKVFFVVKTALLVPGTLNNTYIMVLSVP